MSLPGLVLALAVGLSLGLLGGGGSVLTVPIFVYVMGFDAKQAIAMSLLVVGAVSLIGAAGHWRHGRVDFRVALIFGALAIPASYAGARLAALISGTTQLALLALVICAAAAFMLRNAARPSAPDDPSADAGADAAAGPVEIVRLAPVSIGVGLLTGLVGVGGGFLIVPALVLLGGVPMKRAIGTSLLVIALNCAAGVVGNLGHVAIPWTTVAAFTAVASLGILAGTHLCSIVSPARLKRAFAVLLLAVGMFVLAKNRHVLAAQPTPPATVAVDTVDMSVVPPDSAIPHDSSGASIRRGKALLQHTNDSIPLYAPSNLRCMSCHLDDGRRPGVAPLIGAYARYPRFVDRSGGIASMEDRINYCLTRSLSGRALPASSREMRDMIGYLAWLSTGVPPGAAVRGQGIPRMPALAGDSARGAALFAPTCAACHGSAGEGTPVAPALWGPRSFSIGASMARQERNAAFIRHAMPYDRPGSLSDQQAFDIAAFVLSHPRPDLPGKSHDWPAGGAPYDVPYDTPGHTAFHPPPLIPRS